MDKEYSTYVLIDGQEVFYVGMTSDLEGRYYQHLHLRDGSEKDKRILQIKTKGTFPTMLTIARSTNKDAILSKEAFFTELFRVLQQPLTNQTLALGHTFSPFEQELLHSVSQWVYGKPPLLLRLYARFMQYGAYSQQFIYEDRQIGVKVVVWVKKSLI